MIKQTIIKNLETALNKLGFEDESLNLEHPANSDFGDYSSSIALKLGKKLKKNPNEIAKDLIKNIPKNDRIDKVEIIPPGFINIWLSKNYLLSSIKEIAENNFNYIDYHLGHANKLIVEFAHPNTLKLFHIGHLRNITTGESIARILEAVGNKIIRANYQGDVGLHIAKCIFRIRQIISKEGRTTLDSMALKDKITFLGKAYAQGNKAYENDEKSKQEIIDVNRMIYEKNQEIMPIWKETRQWSLNYFNEIYKRVYSKFDRLFFESEMPERGVKISKEAQKKRTLEISDGALVFKGKQYGLDTRVFINALGFPTYEGKELALAEKEFSEFGDIDKCIHVVGPEQSSFFKVTFKVEELLDPEKYTNKQYHLVYGWVKLKIGKMSSREGNVIEGEWLLDEAKKKIIEAFKCEESIAETLAVAAIKYSFLKNGIQNTIAFDFNESVSLEGNSGPYLIYTYVRSQSVLNKNKDIGEAAALENISKEELDLIRALHSFPEIVERAAVNLSPNHIATYLFKLAQKFNLFYQKCPILKAENENLKNLRLLITKATGSLIKQGLNLLGIKTVEKM